MNNELVLGNKCTKKQSRSKNVQETRTEKMDWRLVKHGYQLYAKKKEDNTKTEEVIIVTNDS